MSIVPDQEAPILGQSAYRPPVIAGASPTLGALFEALAKAQGMMLAASKDRTVGYSTRDRDGGGGGSVHYSYATLAEVWDTCRVPLSSNGLSVIQQVSQVNEKLITLITILGHASGEFITSDLTLPCGTTAQAVGSAITYARRYGLMALVGIVTDEDDDGRAASERSQGDHRDPPPFPSTNKPATAGAAAAPAKPAGIRPTPPADLPAPSLDIRYTALGRELPLEVYPRGAADFWAYVSKYLPYYCDENGKPIVKHVANALEQVQKETGDKEIKLSSAKFWSRLVARQVEIDAETMGKRQRTQVNEQPAQAGEPPLSEQAPVQTIEAASVEDLANSLWKE